MQIAAWWNDRNLFEELRMGGSSDLTRMRTLLWRHNEHDSVSNHQPHGCLLNRLFRRRSKKTSKLRVTGFWVGNSPGPVNSPHKGPVTRKMFPFDDVIMNCHGCSPSYGYQATLFIDYPEWTNPLPMDLFHNIFPLADCITNTVN